MHTYTNTHLRDGMVEIQLIGYNLSMQLLLLLLLCFFSAFIYRFLFVHIVNV